MHDRGMDDFGYPNALFSSNNKKQFRSSYLSNASSSFHSVPVLYNVIVFINSYFKLKLTWYV